MTTKRGFFLPEDFYIGTANSAFQSEGAMDRDGKSESLMEYYARETAGRPVYANQTTYTDNCYTDEMPDRGCFFYDNYGKYIEDMQKTGQNIYRMSLAWPRIIPTGTGEVNQLAIDHYNKVIDKLLACHITPFVDIYHWDLPQCLAEQGGFANRAFPDWFEAYARVCFRCFGDRVKFWSTFNESQVSIASGMRMGKFPPFHENLEESLLAGQNVLIAHFRAVQALREMVPDAKIGAVNCIHDATPARICPEDAYAAGLNLSSYFDWWTGPMMYGHYPEDVLQDCPRIREAMPEGYREELERYFVPMDFIGVNYYIASRVQYKEGAILKGTTAESFYSAPGQAFAPYPAGLFDAIQYIAEKYPGLPIYITENGCATVNQYDREKECDDGERITYLREHLRMVARAIRCGYPVKGYMYWNDADSYEELRGYQIRFGLTWVDHKTGETAWKKSRYYFSEICKNHMVN